MVVLGQTLSDLEQGKVIRETMKFGNNVHLPDNKYPIRESAVLPVVSEWEYNNSS